MTTIDATPLPGVGLRHDLVTRDGVRLAVITHHTGRRELVIYAAGDPDRCLASARLEADESAALAEVLGGPHLGSERRPAEHSADGLTIDWAPVRVDAAVAGRPLREAVPPSTGAAVAAVVRGGRTIPTPAPDFRLTAGDTVVLVGSTADVRAAAAALERR